MKKLTIKLNDAELKALDELIDSFKVEGTFSNLEKSAFSLLKQWQLSKLKPKTYWLTGISRFTIDAPLAFAFLAFFEDVPLPPTNYLGNRVLQITADIDKTFK